jgi:hypothetical protein
MNITKETRDSWEPLREREDVKKLMAITGLGRTAVYDVYKTGECTISVAAQFIKFYKDKENLKNYITKEQEA